MKISVLLEALTGTFDTDIDRSTKAAERRMKAMERSFNKAFKVVATAAVAAAAGVTLLTRRSQQNIDALAKSADQLNTSTESLATYQTNADLAGVSTEKFTNALRKMVVNIGEAREGTGTAADALKGLGISVEDLISLRADEQFDKIAEKINGLGTQVEKVSAAAGIFGAKQGIIMLSLIQQMGDGAGVTREEMEKLNIALSRVDAAKVEAANDAMTLAGKAAEGFGNTIAVAVAPFIEAVALALFDAAKEANGFRDVVIKAMLGVATSVGVVADVIRGLAVEFKTLEVIARGAASATNLIISPFLQPEVVEATLEGLRTAREELSKLLEEPLPSIGIRDRFFEIIDEANAAAEKAAKARPKGSGAFDVDVEEREKASEKAAAEFQKRIESARTAAIALAVDSGDAWQVYDDGIRKVNEALSLHAINSEEAEAAREALSSRLEDSLSKTADTMTEFWREAARNMQDAFATFLFDPFKDGLDGMIEGFANALRTMAANAAAADLFKRIGTFGTDNADAGGFTGAIAGFFKTAFAGSGADGGDAMAGRAHWIGEEGPEMFVPRTMGTIVPMSAMRGGGDMIQNFVINAPDPNSFRASERQIQRRARQRLTS